MATHKRPSLPELLKFPKGDGYINILEEIGGKYITFSAFLLNDKIGNIANCIAREKMGNMEDINAALVMRWLQGQGRQPVTWGTLIEVLRDTGLTLLAGDIETVTRGYDFPVANPGFQKGSGRAAVNHPSHHSGSRTHAESKQEGGTDLTDYGNGATPHDQRDPIGEDVQVPPALEASDFPLLANVNVKERDGDTTDRLLDCVEVLLMVVNENELRAVLGFMKPICGTFVQATRNSTTFTIGMYGQFPAAVVQTSPGGQGFDGAEQKTMRAIEVVKPSLVISVGVAYGKGGDQKLGDVIVCTIVNDYTYKRQGEKVRPRSSQPSVSPRLLNVFKHSMGWKKERAPNDFCAVVSGPLVCSPDLVDDLKEKEKRFEVFGDAKGGEMESAAILSAIDAVKNHKTAGIIIKAITDWGDGNKHKKWQPFAAHTAAHYVLHHLKQKETYEDLARKKDKFPSEVRQ